MVAHEKYTDENTGEEVTRFTFNETPTGRINIYTDVKEFDLLREHLKPINLSPSNFITNIIKLTNRAIEESKVGEDIKICFGIKFPKEKIKNKEDKKK